MSPPSKRNAPKRTRSKERRSKDGRSKPRPLARRDDGSNVAGSSGGPPGVWRERLLPAGRGRLAESLGWWVVAAILVASPMSMMAGLRDPFRLPKLLLAELLVPVSCLFLCFALRRLERVDGRRVLSLPAVRALLPLWLVSVVSGLLSSHPEHAREALWSLSLASLAIAVWSVALPKKRRALELVLLSGLVLAVLALLQHHEIFQPFELVRQSRRMQMSSLAGNVADLGAYLVLPLLVAQADAVRALAAGRRRLAAVAIGGCLVLLYALLVGQTLSALAAGAAASAVFWLLRAPRRWRLPMLGGALAIGVLGVLLVAPARERVEVKIREVVSGRLNDVLTGRLDGWRAGLDMLAHHPLLGVGPGAYRAEFSTTKLAMIDDGATFWWGHTDGSLFGNAHNEVIELGADLGGLGLLALGWSLWVVLGELRRRPLSPTDDPTDDPVAADRRSLQWAALAALAVLSLTYFPLRTALVGYPYVLVLAWVLEPRAVTEQEEDREAAEAAAVAEMAA